MTKSLDAKLAEIKASRSSRAFIIAEANDRQAGEAATLGFFTANPYGYVDGVTPTLAPDIPHARATDFYIKFDGFETETELTVHALELRMPIAEVPMFSLPPCCLP